MPSEIGAQFRSAMRRFTSTVTIVSAAHDGQRHGMTATAVTSVSMDPPSLLVCVNQTGRLYDVMDACNEFCINVLHTEQSDLSRAFAQACSTERFSCGDWSENARRVPFLLGAQVTIFCRKTLIVPYGTHAVFLGDVIETRTREEISPLLYQDGSYGFCEPLRTAS